MPSPLVSILTLCYNHELYIRDCLDGIIMQKTNFVFEVLIHDDASTDNSAQIISEYKSKYPDIIKPIYQSENQHKKKVGIDKTFQYPRARGKYIAICEGDDYWTDPHKLQKQVELMEKYNLAMCAHSAEYLFPDGAKKTVSHIKKSGFINIRQILLNNGAYFPTASIIFRKELYEKFSDKFLNLPVGDYFLFIYLASLGKVYYINEPMSVYRANAINSWTSKSRVLNWYIDFIKRMHSGLDDFNNFTSRKYSIYVNISKIKVLLEYGYDFFRRKVITLLNKKEQK